MTNRIHQVVLRSREVKIYWLVNGRQENSDDPTVDAKSQGMHVQQEMWMEKMISGLGVDRDHCYFGQTEGFSWIVDP